MKKKGLAAVKQLIKQLSAEDRQALIPFLGELPDSGLQSYDLREELEVLKKHGTRLAAPDDDPDRYLINLVLCQKPSCSSDSRHSHSKCNLLSRQLH